MTRVTHVTVTRPESGQKLIQFLERAVEGKIPRTALMRWIRTGQVRVDGSRVKPFHRVKEGQDVRIPPHTAGEEPPLSNGTASNPFLLRKVYEDRDLLVVAKPPNLPTQPGSRQTDSVVDRVRQAYSRAEWMPTLVHRLDMETSGLLLLAKSYAMLRDLQVLWRQGEVCKIYLAWVEGETGWTRWSNLEDRLQQSVSRRKVTTLRTVEARSRVVTLKRIQGCSLVAVHLLTGRKHQIRIQLSRRGHPVLGDRKYGGRSSGQGLLLHAWHLSWQGRAFTLEPPWTKDFAVDGELLKPALGPAQSSGMSQ
jgi:23S rRNA pseudouridine955/2504/2580 synthase